VACLLARRRRVLAPDLRGHGGTGRLAGGFTLEETRADLEAWLDGLGLEQIDLVGHSWGGRVALDLAAARPRCVRRLALVDPVPPEGLPPVARWLPGLPRAVFAPERGPFVGPEQLARAHRTVSWLRHAEPWMHAAFDASFVRDPDDGARPVLDDEGFGAIYRGLLAPAALDAGRLRDIPVLLALASFSVMGFPGMVRALRRRLPHLRLVRVAGEHSLHATNPVGLARALAAFLDGPRCLIPERPAGTRGPGPDPQGASRDG
jgi:pimeloyl-ACP methyl ester carboxylesterase